MIFEYPKFRGENSKNLCSNHHQRNESIIAIDLPKVMNHRPHGSRRRLDLQRCLSLKNGDDWYTLQGINISHLGEKENHLQKCHFWGDMLVPWRVYVFFGPIVINLE